MWPALPVLLPQLHEPPSQPLGIAGIVIARLTHRRAASLMSCLPFVTSHDLLRRRPHWNVEHDRVVLVGLDEEVVVERRVREDLDGLAVLLELEQAHVPLAALR